jgi:hypothetical protein
LRDKGQRATRSVPRRPRLGHLGRPHNRWGTTAGTLGTPQTPETTVMKSSDPPPVHLLPADPVSVIDALGGLGVTVRLRGGRIEARPAPLPARARWLIRTHRDLLAAVLAAGRSGHVWAPCSVCGHGTLTRADSRPPCRLTPGCPGRHVRRDPR